MLVRLWLGWCWQLWPLCHFRRFNEMQAGPFLASPTKGWEFNILLPFMRLEFNTLGWGKENNEIINSIMEQHDA